MDHDTVILITATVLAFALVWAVERFMRPENMVEQSDELSEKNI